MYQELEENGPETRLPLTIGGIIILLFFGVFGIWAFLAPIQSAAIANGVLSVDSQRKTIQHLEGGIVGEILVAEGQLVEAGELLAKLDETQPLANLDLLNARMYAARALETRLRAERDGQDALTFPPLLASLQGNADVQEILESQTNIFTARKLSLEGQIAILERRIEQFGKEIEGINGMVNSQDDQLMLLDDELSSNQILFDQGLTGKPRLRELEREMAELTGLRSQSLAELARSEQNIDEARLQIMELKTDRLNEVVEQLREAQNTIYELNEQLSSAQDVLQRTEILAPLSGTIVDLQIHTIGGVVAPGQALMDIVPTGERIIIEARIDPADIDVVEEGLEANVRLSAYSHRNTLPIPARVNTVSADRFTDERTGASYFLARIELTGELEEDMQLYPGMQAEVMVLTGERTVIEYMVWPIRQSLNRAFREN